MKLNPHLIRSELHKIAAGIKLPLLDVDGVTTGDALCWCVWSGIKSSLINGRDSLATVERARQADITYLYQSHRQLLKARGVWDSLLKKYEVTL